ncbi:MAG: hypothetical protein GXO50_01150 [Chlorobi bacterium]|nr:hypothetical protein [Chlorobiota bacterium]
MKQIVLILFVLFLIKPNLFAQYQTETGARQGGMSGSGVVISDIWSSYHNQAGLANLQGISAGLFYSSIFNMSDLKEAAFAVAVPAEKYGTAGINYTYNGNEFSNFGKLGIAFAKRLGKRISAGIQLDYIMFSQADYGNSGAVAGEAGFIAEPADNLYIGAHIYNPWRAKINDSEDYIESVMRIGAGYYFSEKVLFTVETEKEVDKTTVFRAGTEYAVIPGLFVRAGVSLNPTEYSFGLGYNYKNILIDLAYISHDILGYYMQFGLGYSLKKVSKNTEPQNK